MTGDNTLLTHDTAFRAFEEADDVLDLRTIGHLILNLVNHIEHTRLSMEEQSVGTGYVLLNLLVDLRIIHDGGVGSAISHGVTTGNNIGRYIMREVTAFLDHREVAGTSVGILDST